MARPKVLLNTPQTLTLIWPLSWPAGLGLDAGSVMSYGFLAPSFSPVEQGQRGQLMIATEIYVFRQKQIQVFGYCGFVLEKHQLGL